MKPLYESYLRLGIALMVAVTAVAATPPVGAPDGPPESDAPNASPAAVVEPDTTAPQRPVTFQGSTLGPMPPSGMGRLSLGFDGNRRWCTAPDDRVLKPVQPRAVRSRERLDDVFTFGYQFTIAAIRRGRPDEPIMLYESPVVRTAGWRLASKLPQPARIEPPGPAIGGGTAPVRPSPKDNPSSMVPYWQEPYRCVTVADRFDFDLDPGVYDVYMAFDLLLRDGAWVHRSSGYLTDVPVEGGRQTVLDGRIHSTSQQNREVEFLKSALLPQDSPPAPAVP